MHIDQWGRVSYKLFAASFNVKVDSMFVTKQIESEHKDLIHDVSFDFYGKRMATCSSDQSVKVSFLLIFLRGSIQLVEEYEDVGATSKYFINSYFLNLESKLLFAGLGSGWRWRMEVHSKLEGITNKYSSINGATVVTMISAEIRLGRIFRLTPSLNLWVVLSLFVHVWKFTFSFGLY